MTTHSSNISLKSLHTFQLPYKAATMVAITSAEQLSQLEDDYWVLGEGSNTIFTTDFIKPLVRILIRGIEITETSDTYDVSVGAGENWHRFVTTMLNQDVKGLENLALIPGSVGAAPVQNIGAYGIEVSRYIKSVDAWDRHECKLVTFTKAQCAFGYRDSIFKRSQGRFVITQVQFSFPKTWQATLSYGALAELPADASAQQIKAEVIRIRNAKLPNPNDIPNAGSFFKNPVISLEEFSALQERYPEIPSFAVDATQVKLAAGWLIDRLGLKGFQCGGARVHDKQALVLTNAGSATGADVLALARTVQERVQEHFGVTLEAEVRLLGAEELVHL